MTDRKEVMSWLEWLTFDDWRDYHSDSEVQTIAKEAFALLKEQEDVVRCRDCKWYDERISLCDNLGLPREQTFFCADGERRIDDA